MKIDITKLKVRKYFGKGTVVIKSKKKKNDRKSWRNNKCK